ncbi:GH92 family glycosyl hydrolase [Flexithrix dorotheae]|uniref:GH92 family glycosyl hydrolase n=1 Tax=Flexithrix dorotheae TaxID=70993 RepID=UPI000369B44C|nr:GH92 family glycosyl hydrolase [Flexithrix dorotheae]
MKNLLIQITTTGMIKVLLNSVFFVFFVSCNAPDKVVEVGTDIPKTLNSYVDPFIGTAYHGHTFPGAAVPFGMIQLSPDNGTNGWDWCSGYHYSDSIIVGFSHTHLSGTGIGDLADILFMPTRNQVDLTKKISSREDYDFKGFYTHEKESASPGYYSVEFEDSEIKVELTTSSRVGLHRYSFPEKEGNKVVLDLGFAINWDAPLETYIKVENDSTITGYRRSKGWANDQRVYFAAQFSSLFQSYQLSDGLKLEEGAKAVGLKANGIFNFNTNQVLLKVGISSASVEGALKGIESDLPHWDFERTKTEAAELWEKELEGIQVQTSDENLKRIFYTAFYHTKLAPALFSDALGNYKGADGNIHSADNYKKYTIFSLWDTFRAANPLYTLVQQDKVNDFIHSMMAHYREYGLLPVWELTGNETNTMTGYHAIPVIADAILKGFDEFDAEEAYEAMKKSSMQDIRGVKFYKEYHYIPSELEEESVTKTLEYAYDDWCIAQVARHLGKTEDYKYYMKRSSNYKNVFDKETGFMRGKSKDGIWVTPFDPKKSSHRVNTDYTEGNAWQHSWFVPHDIAGLIELHGGQEKFIEKLDQLFVENSEITGDNISADISGLIGQYAHGNEPSHHIAYMYNYAGVPWKTQEIIRKILETMYTDQPDGLCGNEDCGQMSAWYVFSAMGLYPVNPAEGIYVIGSPMFEESKIPVGDGKTFIITAENVSKTNKYIQSATLNGKSLDVSYITHKTMMDGGNLVLKMGAEPNKDLWTSKESFPPSVTVN